eukprot:gene11721-biopygen2046
MGNSLATREASQEARATAHAGEVWKYRNSLCLRRSTAVGDGEFLYFVSFHPSPACAVARGSWDASRVAKEFPMGTSTDSPRRS